MKNGDYILVRAPENYPGKKYRGKYCYEHHLVFWSNSGILPGKDEIIHHIDGDKHNNSIMNLKLDNRGLHTSKHQSNRGKQMLEIKCPICGGLFVREKRNTYLKCKSKKFSTCSRKCSGKLSYINKDNINMDKYILRAFKKYN